MIIRGKQERRVLVYRGHTVALYFSGPNLYWMLPYISYQEYRPETRDPQQRIKTIFSDIRRLVDRICDARDAAERDRLASHPTIATTSGPRIPSEVSILPSGARYTGD